MLLLLLFMSVAEAPGRAVPDPCPITVELKDQLHPLASRAATACAVEDQLRDAGWEDALVGGALVNAWFESGWNSDAVGPGGHALGFWQLEDVGLGHGMGDARRDPGDATERIIAATERQGLHKQHFRSRAGATSIFCRKVLRPRNSAVVARRRARKAVRRRR
jgi:hypothetical protein